MLSRRPHHAHLIAYRGLSVVLPSDDESPIGAAVRSLARPDDLLRGQVAALLAVSLAEAGYVDGELSTSSNHHGATLSVAVLDPGCGCREQTGVPKAVLERALELVGMQLARIEA